MTTANPPLPPELPPELAAALDELAGTEQLLVALDFDGTLAPLVPVAADARPLPAAAAALARLAALPRTTTALVSGRHLASLRVVADPPPGTLLIGSHGAEVQLGPDAPDLELTPAQAAALAAATDVVVRVAADHPGTTLEVKPAGIVLHYRQAAPGVGLAAAAAARHGLEELPGVFVTEGKMVVEVAVVQADKGQGLTLLRTLTGATATLFAGDDVTDEHGFAALVPGDVGIKVGSGPTAAAFRLDGPEQLPAVLELLWRRRHAHTHPK